jgi:hypothetical protein
MKTAKGKEKDYGNRKENEIINDYRKENENEKEQKMQIQREKKTQFGSAIKVKKT